MNLRCKTGELALVVGQLNAGSIVRCLSVIGTFEPYEVFKHPRTGQLIHSIRGGPVWDVDGLALQACADRALRPLRNDEGEDETLRIAGKPQEHLRARLDALHRQMDDHMRRLREVAEKVHGVREAAR